MDATTIMDHYHALTRKGLYADDTFWCQLTYRLNADESLDDMEWREWRSYCNYLISLGPEIETTEERYFNMHGEYYDDYRVNTYEEDVRDGVVLIEEEYNEDYY